MSPQLRQSGTPCSLGGLTNKGSIFNLLGHEFARIHLSGAGYTGQQNHPRVRVVCKAQQGSNARALRYQGERLISGYVLRLPAWSQQIQFIADNKAIQIRQPVGI